MFPFQTGGTRVREFDSEGESKEKFAKEAKGGSTAAGQDFSVEWQSRLSQVRGTVVTNNSQGTVHSRSERLGDLLRQRSLIDRVDIVGAKQHHEQVEEKRDI